MKKLALVALSATLLGATPVLAQGVSIRAGESGVSIRAGDRDDRYRSRTIVRERRGPGRVIVRDRGPDRVIVRSDEGCRTVTIRERNAFGDRVTKRIRRC